MAFTLSRFGIMVICSPRISARAVAHFKIVWDKLYHNIDCLHFIRFLRSVGKTKDLYIFLLVSVTFYPFLRPHFESDRYENWLKYRYCAKQKDKTIEAFQMSL